MHYRNYFSGFISSFFIFLLLISPTAHAANYYVATTGIDSNPGSEAAPWKTIAYAVNKMVAGDTTYVKGGVYNETESAIFGKTGTQSAPIRLMAAPGESPVIDYGRSQNRIWIWNDKETITYKGVDKYGKPKKFVNPDPTGWIVIEGFEIRNSANAIRLGNAHDITIRRNWVHHSLSQGILGNGTRILIDRNVVNYNGGRCINGKAEFLSPPRSCNQVHALYLTGSNYTITNNLIYDNLAVGIHVAGYMYATSSGQYRGPMIDEVPDKSYAEADNFLIANNTIAYQRHGCGIELWLPGSVNSRIINNILYENNQNGSGPQGICFTSPGGGHKLQNNLFYATSPGATAPIETGYEYTETGSINANPNFEGAGATLSLAGVPNLKLQPGSPAIDKGQSLSEVTWDHQGIKRPAGAAFEIGAYEFCPPGIVCEQGSPPPNPTGGGAGGFPSSSPPVLKGPNGEVCPSGF